METYEDIEIKRDVYDGQLGKLVNRLLDDNRREEGRRHKVIILSAPDSPETLKLPQPVPNDKRSKTGKTTAFTMGQRYVSSEALLKANTTSDLD